MENEENESFDSVLSEALNRKAVRDYRMGILPGGLKTNSVMSAEDVVDHYAILLRDAHRREVAELREIGRQMLTRWCNMKCSCEHCSFRGESCERWRKAIEEEPHA